MPNKTFQGQAKGMIIGKSIHLRDSNESLERLANSNLEEVSQNDLVKCQMNLSTIMQEKLFPLKY